MEDQIKHVPPHPSTYIGNQVLISSDRLIFNAKSDSILLYSDKVIGFSTNGSFHFDTSPNEGSKFIVNAPEIYLGLLDGTKLPVQPAVLSDDLISVLDDIVQAIGNVYMDMAQMQVLTGTPGKPTGWHPLNFELAMTVNGPNGPLQDIRNKFNNIKSLKTKLT